MNKMTEKPWWQPGLEVFAEITGWIAAPIIIALYLGRWLDEKNNSEPLYYLSLTGVAFVVSCVGIVLVAGKYIKKMEREGNKGKVVKKDEDINEPGNRK